MYVRLRISQTDNQHCNGKVEWKGVNIHIFPAAEVKIVAENTPLKTVVNQNAHFLVSITSSTGSVPWKTIDWYKLNGKNY